MLQTIAFHAYENCDATTVVLPDLSCGRLEGTGATLGGHCGRLADPEQEHFTLHDGDMVSLVDGEVVPAGGRQGAYRRQHLLSDGTILGEMASVGSLRR